MREPARDAFAPFLPRKKSYASLAAIPGRNRFRVADHAERRGRADVDAVADGLFRVLHRLLERLRHIVRMDMVQRQASKRLIEKL